MQPSNTTAPTTIKMILVAALVPAALAGELTGPGMGAFMGGGTSPDEGGALCAGGAAPVGAPHAGQNRPLAGVPHCEQKLAMFLLIPIHPPECAFGMFRANHEKHSSSA